MKHLFSALLVTVSTITFGQASLSSDCNTAIKICSKNELHLISGNNAGLNTTELDEAPCLSSVLPPGNIELNSLWIKFTAATAGSLWFKIIPTTPDKDYDFVLFQLAPDNNCDNPKQVLRCMASGAGGIGGFQCLGETGLRPGETDTIAFAGCSSDVNAFLAPVNLTAGGNYALAVLNFTGFPNDPFRIQWCGTALLDCETDICATNSVQEIVPKNALQQVQIIPNPTTSATGWELRFDWPVATTAHIVLSNALGQFVCKQVLDCAAGNSSYFVPAEKLPAGNYYLSIQTETATVSRLVQLR